VKKGLSEPKYIQAIKITMYQMKKTRGELRKIILPFVEGTNAGNKRGNVYARVPTRHELKNISLHLKK